MTDNPKGYPNPADAESQYEAHAGHKVAKFRAQEASTGIRVHTQTGIIWQKGDVTCLNSCAFVSNAAAFSGTRKGAWTQSTLYLI